MRFPTWNSLGWNKKRIIRKRGMMVYTIIKNGVGEGFQRSPRAMDIEVIIKGGKLGSGEKAV